MRASSWVRTGRVPHCVPSFEAAFQLSCPEHEVKGFKLGAAATRLLQHTERKAAYTPTLNEPCAGWGQH
jgi:hypothetical protein